MTGLRGIAALSIVLFHLYDAPSVMIVRHGYMAVDLFFVLSGFVMTMVYAEDFAAGATVARFLAFLGKRLARIYPVYLAMTLSVIVLMRAALIATPAALDPVNLAANLLLIQNWTVSGTFDGVSSLVGPAWSLSTEMAAYMAFPLLLPLVTHGAWTRVSAALLVAVALLVFVATRSAAEVHQPSLDGTRLAYEGPLHVYAASTCYPLLRCLADFVIGMAAFRLGAATPGRLLGRPCVAETVAIAIFALLCHSGTEVPVVLLFGVLIAALSFETSLVSAILASRPVHWLGLVSYSLYLAHTPFDLALRGPTNLVLAHLHDPNATLLAPLALMPPLIGFAAAIYYLVEKPGRRWMRDLPQRKAGLLASAAASTS